MASTSSLQSRLASCENTLECGVSVCNNHWCVTGKKSTIKVYTVEPVYSGHHWEPTFTVCSKMSLTQGFQYISSRFGTCNGAVEQNMATFSKLSLAVRWGEKAKQRLVLSNSTN